MNTLLPFFALYSVPPKQDVPNYASLFGETVLICTQNGFKLVKWEDLQTGKEQPSPHPKYECALCYVAAHGVKAPALAQAVIVIPELRAPPKNYTITDIAVSDQFSGYRFHSRAPPFIA